MRFGIGRNNYRVKPGIYAIGNPNQDSPVFASANYKLSFDTLRKELKHINGWILVLDTKGMNLWCAAAIIFNKLSGAEKSTCGCSDQDNKGTACCG